MFAMHCATSSDDIGNDVGVEHIAPFGPPGVGYLPRLLNAPRARFLHSAFILHRIAAKSVELGALVMPLQIR